MTSHPLRPGLPPLPPAIAKLPIDERGYPVPWFVGWVDGKPEFRCMDGRKLDAAIKRRLCWVCGEPLGIEKTFVIGPMCTVNRVSSEPASHLTCAEFSVQACPFLTKPHMCRRENDLPQHHEPPGVAIMRNPGVTALWTTQSHTLEVAGDGVLFRLGWPESVSWWAEGRTATRAEVEASIESGLPILQKMADEQGPEAVAELKRMVDGAKRFLPPPTA